MDRSVLMAIVVAFMALLLALMYWGWRSRKRRQSDYATPSATPLGVGDPLVVVEGFYVATTAADEPLNRIAIGGLGFRARVTTSVFASGIALGIPGQDVFIPAANIVLADRATWTIDRVVEDNGLSRVAWLLGDTRVDSYFRMGDPEAFLEAVATIIPQRTGPHGK
ncbi:MAG: hypothetical protein ACOH1T_06650 [Microbacteriaceae bacterium]